MKKAPIRLAALALFAALGASSALAQSAPQPGTAEYDSWVGQQLTRLQQYADRDAVEQLMYHYGRGNDELGRNFADREGGTSRAIAEYEKAFTSDVQITVYPLRSTTPLRQVRGIAEWVPFVNGFFDQAKYSNTLHLMSNFDIAFPDANTARGTAFAHVPHYIRSAAKDAASADVTVENMLARYEFSAARQQDGSWRINTMTIYLDEIMRQNGFFPNGQQPGK
jgi:hypothetical protein